MVDKETIHKIAISIVEMATDGYYAPVHGAWYWVNGSELVYVAPRQNPPWSDEDEVISVVDLLPEGVELRWFNATPPAWALEGLAGADDPETVYNEAFNAALFLVKVYLDKVFE